MENNLDLSPAPIRTPITDKRFQLNAIWSRWFDELFTRIGNKATNAIDQNVRAGYGGIAVEGTDTLGTINATWKTITGYDADLITKPNGVTHDKANDGMIIKRVGLWEFSLAITLEFDEENFGRKIMIRGYNDTQGAPGPEFTFFVGRNQAGINIPLVVAREDFNISVGDLLILQVSSASDTFANTDNIGTLFQVKNIAERSFSG